MKTVAIICEYNPFHNGHLHHVNEIRKEFGEDTAIIAVMSGNYTQRGEMAIADKSLRARCACDAGVNLVLELPFPYSCSSAEFFALAGVQIADEMNADILSFGSESGDVSALERTAEVMLSEEYASALDSLTRDGESSSEGYPHLCERAFKTVSADVAAPSFTPNNILAIEYIKAIKKLNSKIQPHTVKRIGSAYDEESLVTSTYQSAMAIRNEIQAENYSALDFLPISTKSTLLEAKNRGEFPCDPSKLNSAVISFFRLNPPMQEVNIHDAKGGLDNRLRAMSFKTNDIQNLTRLTETKKFTKARIKRAIWYSFFGVTSSDVKSLPRFTQLLATDGIGRALLKKEKKRRQITVLTKPSSLGNADDATLKQIALSQRADSVFQMTKPAVTDGNYSLTFTPYVKD